LAVLMIVGLVLLATRLRTEMIQKRKEELEHEVAVRTAELAANQTELVKANQQLAELATRDPLTGVFNRRQFIANAESELQRTRRTGSPFTLLLMDADHFKSINDRFGHMAGDEVLKSLVLQIAGQLRRNDLLARYGGEELVVLLVDTTLEEGLVMAERLRDHVEASLVLFDGANIRVTVSIGAAEASREEGLDELLMRADTALYEAKSQGRNRVVAAGADPSHRSA
jgi:diguanylate cyclase (GGDEF)-like protein